MKPIEGPLPKRGLSVLEARVSDHQVIVFDHVSKTYASGVKRQKSIALTHLTYAVEQSEVFGIIGPNGAGKSTAMKILMGFVKRDAGEVRLSGLDPVSPAAHEKIGYLPETPCLYEHLSLREQLRFAGRIARYPTRKTASRIDALLHLVDLPHAADTPIRKYSKGMTQRAALAYALFHEPEILVLDEPMSGLDPLGRQLVVEIIKDYNKRGNTILFCSHILTDVERICDRIGIMNHGRLVSTITPGELDDRLPRSRSIEGASTLVSYFLETISQDR
jgi:ABC-2 type transport system ATP-binding protein